jgi:hypothetical protein
MSFAADYLARHHHVASSVPTAMTECRSSHRSATGRRATMPAPGVVTPWANFGPCTIQHFPISKILFLLNFSEIHLCFYNS